MCGLSLNRLTLSLSTHTYASSQKLIKQIGSRNFDVIFMPEYPPSGRYRSNAPKYERWMRHQLLDHFWAMEDCLSLFGQFPELTLVFHTRNSACTRVHPQALEPQRTASRCVRRTHVSITPSNLPRIRITRVHTDSLRNSKFSQTAGVSWKDPSGIAVGREVLIRSSQLDVLIRCTHPRLSLVQSNTCPGYNLTSGLLYMKGSQILVHFFREKFSGVITTTGCLRTAMSFVRGTVQTGYRRGELMDGRGWIARMA